MDVEENNLEFKAKLANIRHTLKTLGEKQLITPADSLDFSLCCYSARSLEDLQMVVKELALVCQGQRSNPRGLRVRLSSRANS